MALDPNIGRIKFLRSKTAGLTPTTADIDEGELALNLVDRTIYTRNGNNIIDMGFGKGGQVNGNITASGTVKATKLEGPLTGNATTATSLQNARTINGVNFDGTSNIVAPANRFVITKDQRALKPVDLDTRSAGFYFTSLGGMTDTANSTYGDLITLNSYGDSSGGNQNALFFRKSAMQILHYQSTSFGAETWGTPKTLAYTDSSITGNAATATSLQTARTINGVSFNGTANITIADSTKLPLAGGTMIGQITTKATATATAVTDLGTGSTAPIKVPVLQVGSTYGFAPFLHGSAQSSSGYVTQVSFGAYKPEPTWTNSGAYIAVGGSDANPTEAFLFQNGRKISNNAGAISLVGNADTATKLQTSRTISLTGGVTGSVNFDGSANASIAATVTGLGVANGIATLDSSGQVPSTQLPSYVDDVLEYLNVAAFPTTGESGKIYVETTGNTTYRWSGSAYVKITSGEVASVAGKTGVVTLTKSDVGLSNVDNTSDIDKPISTATQTALTSKINLSEKGVANGVATLNSSVEIPIAQIPYRIFNKVIGIGGEGVDLTMTGLYDRNQLALADKEHTVTATITGAGRFDSSDVLFKDIVFNQSSNFAALSGCDATTQLVVTINLSSTLTNYSRALWQPFVQTRLDTTQSFRNIQVEVQDTSNVWYSPAASNVTNITYIPKSGMYIFPELNPGTASIKAIRFTFTNPNTTNGVVYMSNIGFRHVSHTYAPQYLHRGFNNTIYGTNTFTNTIIGSISGNSGTATSLQTARTIGGVSFDGTANINLPGVNTAGNQSTSGNAATATTLATARTINGTSFNGSANITTANWGTARNFTIGNTAKSVDGSGNVAWSLAEIGALPTAGGTMTGPLTNNRINLNSFGDNGSGILWYSTSSNTWQDYMASAGSTGNGYSQTITAPTGVLVTGSGRRSLISDVTGYGWTFEVGTFDTTAPTIVAEISSTGESRWSGAMTVVGNITATGNITAFSDARLKDNITKIPDALNKLNQLKGVTYTRKDIASDKQYAGLIAQDVQKVLPEAVATTEGDIIAVDYNGVIGLLVEAIKELNNRIDKLERI